MAENTPIPVNAARRIADQFQQQIVVIVAWHAASNQLNTVTYADHPKFKAGAAKLGDILAAAAGADLSKVTSIEDYRHVKEAEWAAEKAELLRRIEQLEGR